MTVSMGTTCISPASSKGTTLVLASCLSIVVVYTFSWRPSFSGCESWGGVGPGVEVSKAMCLKRCREGMENVPAIGTRVVSTSRRSVFIGGSYTANEASKGKDCLFLGPRRVLGACAEKRRFDSTPSRPFCWWVSSHLTSSIGEEPCSMSDDPSSMTSNWGRIL